MAVPSRLDAVARAGAILDELPRRLRDEAICRELACKLDTFLVSVARSRGALDVAIGERLDALSVGLRALDLGYCDIGAYAREELGIAASTAQKMARVARRLRDTPLLRDAVRDGLVSVRKAEAVLPKARGEAEAEWVARARSDTVRALKVAAKEEEDEAFARLCLEVTPEQRAIGAEAREIAGRVIGATASRWQRLEAIAQECLGGVVVQADAAPRASAGRDDAAAREVCAAPEDDTALENAAREWLERESGRWEFLRDLDPVPVAEPLPDDHVRARELHAELLRLRELRERWDGVFGQLAAHFVRMQAWRMLEFTSVDHYAEERLGMSGRAVEQRAWLERRLQQLPALKQAVSERRLSYEQARLIARHAQGKDVKAWIARAASGMSCVELRTELEGKEDRKMCARGTLTAVVPVRVLTLLSQAFDALRREAGTWLSPGECYARACARFTAIWKPVVGPPRNTLQKRVIARNGGRCTVPGCTRPAVHAHHIVFRSQGGKDDDRNETGLCALHHLRGIHEGRIRVWGLAPDDLNWEIGVSPGLEPIRVVGPRSAWPPPP